MKTREVASHASTNVRGMETLAQARDIVARFERLSVAQHPLFVSLSRDVVDMSTLWLLMANLRAGISRDFVIWLALTIARVEDRRIGSLLAKQLDDELGKGDVEAIHSTLLDHFVDALARWRIEGAEQRLLSPGHKLLEEARAPFYAEDPYEAVGALIVGEIFANKMDRCLGDQIRRQGALSEKELTWLTLHETLEANHAEDSGELAQFVPEGGAALAAAWRGADAQWASLWRFLDRVHALRDELRTPSFS
jgi:pyrroloquinoline quinone (PQQ) biosynthesis protein C